MSGKIGFVSLALHFALCAQSRALIEFPWRVLRPHCAAEGGRVRSLLRAVFSLSNGGPKRL